MPVYDIVETSLLYGKHIESRKDMSKLSGLIPNYKCRSGLTVYTPTGDDKDWGKSKVAENS